MSFSAMNSACRSTGRVSTWTEYGRLYTRATILAMKVATSTRMTSPQRMCASLSCMEPRLGFCPLPTYQYITKRAKKQPRGGDVEKSVRRLCLGVFEED